MKSISRKKFKNWMFSHREIPNECKIIYGIQTLHLTNNAMANDNVFCLSDHLNNHYHSKTHYIDPFRVKCEGDNCKWCFKIN